MLEVYNHLISTYQPKYKNYNTIEKKNLKNVYHSILLINKMSPIFKLNLTNEKQAFALSIKDAALSLKYHLDDLAEIDNSIFTERYVKSSDSNTADVTILRDNKGIEYLPEEISIKVHNLAKPQMNQSYEVLATEVSGLSGSYNFKITVDDSMYEYQLQILAGSTNETILTKLSDFINKSSIGIHAEINKNSKIDQNRNLDTIKLTLTSMATGFLGEPIFIIEDSDKVEKKEKGMIERFGLNRIKQNPESAVIEINGEQKEVLNNKFTLNKVLSVTLKQNSEETVFLQSVPDEKEVLKEMNQTLSTYNSLIDLAISSPFNRRSAKLFRELDNIVSQYSEQLLERGIVLLENNHLAIDEQKAIPSIKDGTMKELFSMDEGFNKRLCDIAYSISLNPIDYLDKIIVTYPNTSIPGTYNPYITSIYSGMLFNYYC